MTCGGGAWRGAWAMTLPTPHFSRPVSMPATTDEEEEDDEDDDDDDDDDVKEDDDEEEVAALSRSRSRSWS